MGAFSAGMFYGIGSTFAGVDAAGALTAGQAGAKVLMRGIAGGIMSELQGGKFGHGFASAAVTQAFSSKIDNIDKGVAHSAKRVIAAAALGGSVSAATGGKFANGAITGAFSRAFNDEAHRSADRKVPLSDDESRFVEDGDHVGFWRSRFERGDPWARNALGIWDPDHPGVTVRNRALGAFTVNRLMNYMALRDGVVLVRDQALARYADELVQIGRKLASAHAQAVMENGGAAVSLESSNDYHRAVFKERGIWPMAYGGTPVGGLLPGAWQSAGTNFIFRYCENGCQNK